MEDPAIVGIWSTKIRPSIRKHHRLLTFIGALIVFVTFVVKEGLRDHLKDLISSIDATENVFLVRQDEHTVLLRLRQIKHRLLDCEAKKRKGRGATREMLLGFAREDVSAAEETEENLLSALDNITRLLDKLPPEADTRASLETIKRNMETSRTRHKDFITFINNDGVITNEDSANQDRIAADMGRLMEGQTLENFGLYQDALDLAKVVLDKAQMVSKKKESLFNFYSWVSYCLYVIGWGVGLAAHIGGLERVGGGD
jgi:hypothetical protein